MKAKLKGDRVPGLFVRTSLKGSKSYVVIARDRNGKQVWHTLGSSEHMKIAEARNAAPAILKAIKEGKDREGPQSFEKVAADWMHRHVDAKGLRTRYEIDRQLRKHVMPEWGGREFGLIRRGDVAKLLDKIEDSSGARTADVVLAIISSICTWYAKRNEDYSSPIIRGMKRQSGKEHARSRILNDNEIRTLWNAFPLGNADGDMIKLLLLTGQRLGKVQSMRFDDVSADGVWTIRTEAREKGNASELVLPELALDVIRARPHFVSNPHVFASRGSSYSYSFDTLVSRAPKLDSQWQLHDLRRTARSLISRAGVRPDVAERVLGHAIRGVEGVYDRHGYKEEKGHALRALAGLLENILRPPADNVVALAR